MTNNDLRCIDRFIHDRNEISPNLKVGVLSPIPDEYNYYSNFFKDISVITKNEWDLNYSSDYNFDIIIASNVFHYSNNPQKWIDNIMNSCNLFLIQDLMKRQRDRSSEFGDDGDSVRYSFDKHVYFNNAFNLSKIKYKIINSYIYNGDVNEYDPTPKHFVCLMTHDT